MPDTVQGRPVVGICRSGHRSRQTAKLPASRDIDAVDVPEGIAPRARAGRPVVDEGGRGGRIA
ncbi:hypothetical protein [Streptomyces melanosporofaciens]|uniref:hypothetical protein n=1 Tax=Streptomyces melanosporofaciens TaxID=67327 RepID=UPI0031390F5B